MSHLYKGTVHLKEIKLGLSVLSGTPTCFLPVPGEEDLGVAGLLRGAYSAGPVSPTCSDLKCESWLRAATLDDSKTPTPVLHNTSVVV